MKYLSSGQIFALSFACMFFSSYACAAQDEAMARAQFMIRQISAERDQLQSDKANMQKQLDELKKKYDGLENTSAKSSGDMKQQFVLMRDALDKERADHEETRKKLADTVAEKNKYTDMSTLQGQSLETCIANNHKLYEMTHTLLNSYENKGVWDSIVQSEPVTGISQIHIENLIDDMQYHLDDLRVSSENTPPAQVN